ncbi:flagellar attachment zone protein 1-like [Ipomoea triloba]|uniref:flagellar attachment zone protein 1-like n=1 Tax=Ipomoea triloba TaxID=35885 RepID=UPI00125D8601|nr:flagellar attachment zone protein 1-like [Ipomoea triloba]
MAPIQLLGPPEIDRAKLSSVADHGGEANTPPVDTHGSDSSTKPQGVQPDPNPLMGFTENGSATFLSTGNPCLDFFFHVVPHMPPQDLIGRLDVSWAHNPLTTLKLICNLRGVRGTGKSDKEGFYLAALWLHYNHPKTLSGNLKALAEFGYFKDFLEILYRILEGPYVRKFEKEQRENSSRRRSRFRRGRRRFFYPENDDENDDEVYSDEVYGSEENDHDENHDEGNEEEEKIKKDSEELMSEKDEIKKDSEELMSEKDEIKKDSEELMSEKDEIKKDSEELMSEKDEIKKDSEGLMSEKDEIKKDSEELMAEKDEMEKDWEEELLAEAEKEKIKKNLEKLKPKKEKIKKTPEELMAEKEKARAEKEKARVLRKQRELNKAVKGLQTYITDEKYRLLHDKISDLFAEMLEADLEKLKSGNLGDISLAAKWCPTIDSSYDKTTLICESIARKLFPREKYTEYECLKEAHYVYKVRDRLRKQVLVPLHKALELPEVYMSAKQWNVLPYKRVASVAMKNYTKKFAKHDNERFTEYLRKVKSGEAKIAAGALLPHEIIKSLERADPEETEVAEVAELQWKRMVDDLANKGKLSNCIAICDVSGSMSGIPMDVSVALGILVSELSEEPWKGNLITFSADPQLHKIKGETLLEKTAFVKTMDWGMNTNFQKAFDRILEIAVEGKLSQEQMIRRVFVFSDMEFDEVRRVFDFSDMEFDEVSENPLEVSENPLEVSENPLEVSENPLEVSENPLEGSENPLEGSENSWETDYEVIQRKFREKGFTNVPEVVFWNLRASRSTPVVANQSGVALVSGFSKNLLTIFLENGGIVNPEEVMELAISGEEYKKLAVLD